MRLVLILPILASSAIASCQFTTGPSSPQANVTPTPLFSSAEKSAVMAFWSQPDRYTVTVPDAAMDKGLWQVRLTNEGSQWLWNLTRGKKTTGLGTFDAPVPTEDQKTLDAWIAARVARDRWEAWRQAVQANLKVLGKELPAPDPTIPVQEPPLPGPVPPTLLAQAGDPPRFARIVVPMQHSVRFDDDTVVYQDNFRPSNPKYAFYRYPQGVGSNGTSVKSLPSDRLSHLFRMAGVSESESRIMRAVSMLEGGFDSVNTYDTGFVSVGFIQFACLKDGAGSLGTMLNLYKSQNPDQFQRDFRDFGIDVTPTGQLAILDPSTGAELYGADAAQRMIEDKRLIAVFQRAGHKSDPYVSAQISAAKAQFFPAEDPITLTCDGQVLTGKVGDVIKSEAGLATLMDRKVNTGNLGPFATVLTQVGSQIHPQSLADLSKYEYDIVSQVRYRKDYLTDASLSQPQPSGRTLTLSSRGSMGRNGRRHRIKRS